MKRIIHNLKSNAGLTLAETLLAVVILLLASSVVATGMPAAVNAYRNAIDAANAQVLLSAAVNALRGELSTARDVKVNDDGTAVTYIDAGTGSRSRIFLGTENSESESGENTDEATSTKIMQQKFMIEEESDGSGTEPLQPAYPLLSAEMRRTTKDGTPMTVLYEKIELEGNHVTFKDLSVKRGGTVLAQMPEGTDLTIQVLTIRPQSGGG